MFQSGIWFAWFPVQVSRRGNTRTAWLETVYRDRIRTAAGNGAWRYYAI